MNHVVEEKLDQILSLCDKYKVAQLELFGSAAGDNFSEESDLDFLVIFKDMDPGDHAHAYFELKFALEDLFGRQIDLVEIRAVHNPYFLESINRNRTLLYAA